tara:strand:- start:241 stop:1347 length:1107 start_codon:yes stop_codon:yes gene_type:complete
MLNKIIHESLNYNSSTTEQLLQKIKTFLILAVFTFSSFNVFAQNTSLISNCSDFVTGSNPAWPYVLVATTPDSLAASQGAQTFIMNVTDTANGASVRVYKTTANGNAFFGNPLALSLGPNSITVAAVTFDRAVKFQFSNGDVEFDALVLNGDTSSCVVPPPPPPPSTSSLISACSDFVVGSNPAWPYVLVATILDSGAVSQGAQTFTMNVTDTASGASVRVYKTTANGNDFFGNPVALTLGSNSITVASVTFDRAVKFQFSSGDVEFDALSLNGVDSDCIATINALNEYDNVFLKTFPNPSYGDLLIESNDPIELLEIKDLSGRVVMEMTPEKSKVQIQTSQLKNYFYILSCYINKEWIRRKIIIKQR